MGLQVVPRCVYSQEPQKDSLQRYASVLGENIS